MALARELTTHSLPEIGDAFGGRDHTTVLYAVKAIEMRLKTDDGVKKIVTYIERQLKQ